MNFENTQTKIYTISELTKNIKLTLENSSQFNNIWVKGEIYNLTLHSSGHIYFTLKDNDALISAVFFKYANKTLSFKLEEGMSILALGSITVFEKRGSYQINILQVRLEGIGELQKRIDQLKKKLLAEGIFDKDHKKQLPFLPRRVGIVTSPTGAAVRDIIKVALRRYPNIEIVIAPAKVQGDDAAVTIVRGIEELNKVDHAIDVIIAGRGGGSFEDLMPFNEEIVVRAFYNSKVPIISAVGHQIDHPLSDDAADIAAPTPSAAAELAIPMKKELISEIDYLLIRCNNALQYKFNDYQNKIESIINRRIFKNPLEMIYNRELQLTDLENRITYIMKEIVSNNRKKLLQLPDINILVKNIIKNKSYHYNVALKSLEQLSPLAVLKRGYSIVLDEKNTVIKSIDDAEEDQKIIIQLYNGKLLCNINSIQKGEGFGKEKN